LRIEFFFANGRASLEIDSGNGDIDGSLVVIERDGERRAEARASARIMNLS
jgi:hypothetical protein